MSPAAYIYRSAGNFLKPLIAGPDVPLGTSTPTSPKLVMGMYNNCSVTFQDGYSGSGWVSDSAPAYREIANAYLYDPVNRKVRRDFAGAGIVSSLANTGQAGSQDVANGCVPYVSCNPDPNSVIAGTFDPQITSWAQSMPAGSYMTIWHEFESPKKVFVTNRPLWVSMFRKFYTVAKAANPNVTIGPASLVYQYKPGQPGGVNPQEWYVGDAFCDILTADTYWLGTDPVTDIYSTVANGHTAWHNVNSIHGKPLGLTEWGMTYIDRNLTVQTQVADVDGAKIIDLSMPWLAANNYKLLLWWNGYQSNAGMQDFNVTPTKSTGSQRPLSLAAWNRALQTYGATTSDIRRL